MQPETAETVGQQLEQLKEQLTKIDMKLNAIPAIDMRMNEIQRKLVDAEQRLAQNIRDIKSLHATMMQMVTFFSGQSGPRH